MAHRFVVRVPLLAALALVAPACAGDAALDVSDSSLLLAHASVSSIQARADRKHQAWKVSLGSATSGPWTIGTIGTDGSFAPSSDFGRAFVQTGEEEADLFFALSLASDPNDIPISTCRVHSAELVGAATAALLAGTPATATVSPGCTPPSDDPFGPSEPTLLPSVTFALSPMKLETVTATLAQSIILTGADGWSEGTPDQEITIAIGDQKTVIAPPAWYSGKVSGGTTAPDQVFYDGAPEGLANTPVTISVVDKDLWCGGWAGPCDDRPVYRCTLRFPLVLLAEPSSYGFDATRCEEYTQLDPPPSRSPDSLKYLRLLEIDIGGGTP